MSMGRWDMKQCPQQRGPEWAVEAGADGGSWGTEALSGEMTGGLDWGAQNTALSGLLEVELGRWFWPRQEDTTLGTPKVPALGPVGPSARPGFSGGQEGSDQGWGEGGAEPGRASLNQGS